METARSFQSSPASLPVKKWSSFNSLKRRALYILRWILNILFQRICTTIIIIFKKCYWLFWLLVWKASCQTGWAIDLICMAVLRSHFIQILPSSIIANVLHSNFLKMLCVWILKFNLEEDVVKININWEKLQGVSLPQPKLIFTALQQHISSLQVNVS